MTKKNRCAKKLRGGGRTVQCKHKAGHGPGGRYCTQHADTMQAAADMIADMRGEIEG